MTTTSLPLKYFIGAIQVAGGCLLSYAFIIRFLEVERLNFVTVTLPFLFFVFLSFYAGIKLLFNKKNGINLSIFNFGLQLFQFSFLGLYYYYVIGPYVSLGYQKPLNSSIELWTNYKFFTSTLMIYIREETSSHFLTINLVTVIILVLLLYLKARERERQK